MLESLPCSHCQLTYQKNDLKEIDFNGETLYFCCNGCERVYFLLRNANLSSFYDKLTTTLTPPKDTQMEDLARFDSPAFAKKYIRELPSGLHQVHLIISGIHCTACIWLNEKLLMGIEGIESVNINYTNNKAKIVWDSNKIALSAIIRQIRSIGYDAFVYDERMQENADKKQLKEYYTRVIVALFCTMNIMWVAIAQYSGYFLGIDETSKDILNFAAFLLCTPTLFYSGFVFYRASYYGLKNGFIGMDLLVCVGASLTYAYSIYAGISRSGETYFESVSMIITFVLIGKFLEVRARKNAGDSLDKLSSMLPLSVEVCINDNPQNTKEISPEEVQVGDLLLVKAGDKIAIDGILESEFALCDMSAINGESLPREIKKGQEILSGSINLNYQILYRAQKIFSQSLMSHIIELVEHSFDNRPRIATLANAISQRFSRVVLLIALCCFLGWFYLGGVGVEKSLMNAISVIIIACPCALALATPIGAVVGIGESYKRNVLFKQAQFLENLSKAKMVIFDKTGTITQGAPKVQRKYLRSAFDKHLLLQFLQMSKHPVAQGVARFIKESLDSQMLDSYHTHSRSALESGAIKAQNPALDLESSTPKAHIYAQKLESHTPEAHIRAFDSESHSLKAQNPAQDLQSRSSKPQITDFTQCDAKGIRARFHNKMLFGGNLAFLSQNGFEIPAITLEGGMVFGYGIIENGTHNLIEIYELHDSPKPHARELIATLKCLGIQQIMLSGDRIESVSQVASMVGLKAFEAELNPMQKAQWIESYRQKHPSEVIVMIGDGINDAPALNRSDIAISMGAGSDIAIASSDVVILDDSLASLENAFLIARRTYRGIKQNIALSIGYNALSIPLACAGLVIPLIAALSMSLSSIIVVLNSLRIKSR